MNDLRTAAHQALDACTDVVAGWQSLAPLAVRAAALESLDALRAALEQPEPVQKPVGVVTSMVKGGVTWHRWPSDMPDGTLLYAALIAALEQPAPEPVAYIHRQGNHWEVSERHLVDDEKARGWTEEPLYTAPTRAG